MMVEGGRKGGGVGGEGMRGGGENVTQLQHLEDGRARRTRRRYSTSISGKRFGERSLLKKKK